MFASDFREAAVLCELLLDIVEVVVADDEDDAIEDIEEEELDLSGTFLGMNMRVTSSGLIDVNPPCVLLPEFHPNRGSG